MSTNSIIAKKIGRDKYRAIFCKHDGYLADNGWILSKYYTTPERVDKLLDLGDLYSLSKRLSESEKEAPEEEVTTAYARDKGEKMCPAKEYSLEELYDLELPYLYIFVGADKWVYSGPGELQEELRDVKKALKYLEDAEPAEVLLEEEPIENIDSNSKPTLKL